MAGRDLRGMFAGCGAIRIRDVCGMRSMKDIEAGTLAGCGAIGDGREPLVAVPGDQVEVKRRR